MSCNDRCSNVQREFGEGCYRSGDVLFTYCTPFSNELLRRRCDGNVANNRGCRNCNRN